jgi:hypothetical protein
LECQSKVHSKQRARDRGEACPVCHFTHWCRHRLLSLRLPALVRKAAGDTHPTHTGRDQADQDRNSESPPQFSKLVLPGLAACLRCFPHNHNNAFLTQLPQTIVSVPWVCFVWPRGAGPHCSRFVGFEDGLQVVGGLLV